MVEESFMDRSVSNDLFNFHFVTMISCVLAHQRSLLKMEAVTNLKMKLNKPLDTERSRKDSSTILEKIVFVSAFSLKLKKYLNIIRFLKSIHLFRFEIIKCEFTKIKYHQAI